jgi:hypothetical protein
MNSRVTDMNLKLSYVSGTGTHRHDINRSAMFRFRFKVRTSRPNFQPRLFVIVVIMSSIRFSGLFRKHANNE